MAKVVELKIARGDAGGGGEAGDTCKKSFLSNKSMVPKTFGDKAEVSRSSVVSTSCTRTPVVRKKKSLGAGRTVVGAVRAEDGFQVWRKLRMRIEPTVTAKRASSWRSSAGWSVSQRPRQAGYDLLWPGLLWPRPTLATIEPTRSRHGGSRWAGFSRG